MEVRDNKRIKKANNYILGFNILVITDGIWLFAWIACWLLRREVNGKIITAQFAEDIRFNAICNPLKEAFIALFTFTVIATIVYFCAMGREVFEDSAVGAVVIGIIVVGIMVSVAFGLKAYKPIANDPVVERVTLRSKVDGRGSFGFKRYTLVFSDNSRVYVTIGKYERAEAGDLYYVISCGDEALGAYSAQEYSYRG